MNPYVPFLSDSIAEMESLVAEDDLSQEQYEKLQESYKKSKQDIELATEYDLFYLSENPIKSHELKDLKKRFKSICEKFELSEKTLDEISEIFPDDENIEGFNYDDFFEKD